MDDKLKSMGFVVTYTEIDYDIIYQTFEYKNIVVEYVNSYSGEYYTIFGDKKNKRYQSVGDLIKAIQLELRSIKLKKY